MYVALVGPPNSGKTTLFNWLTGRNQKVVNYPGSTVELSLGPLLHVFSGNDAAEELTVVDTPGTYSLFAKSPDEEVTARALFDKRYDIKNVILVLDSTQLGRQVHLARQLRESGFSVVAAVTMHDLHLKEKSDVDVKKLSDFLGVPVCVIDGTLGKGVKELVQTVQTLPPSVLERALPEAWSFEKLQKVFKEGEEVAKQVAAKELSVFKQTEAKDDILLHPVYGGIVFVVVMLGLFSSIYWAAAPLMDLVDTGFSWAIDASKALLGEGLFSDLVSDGVIAGLGAVFVFVPQIFILFIGISLLEDSGYLARAAAIIDKPLSKIGLNGKAFVPLLSGFACAVPAMMAARSVNSSKERWITMFIIPFMTCSARLPVYALLLGFLFANEPLKAGAAMAALYVGAIFIGGVAATLLNKVLKIKNPGFFLLELPIYRRPRPAVVLRNSLRRTRAYIVKTGPIILTLAVALWALSTFPNYNEQDEVARLQGSYIASVGKGIEPIFEPMGGDWRVGVGLLTAFAAREVFVSSLAVMFNITDVEDDEGLREGLLTKMSSATFADGRPIFTTASVVALLLFFMIALQCISTTATAKHETRSTKFALFQLVAMNVVAYLAAVIAHSVIS